MVQKETMETETLRYINVLTLDYLFMWTVQYRSVFQFFIPAHSPPKKNKQQKKKNTTQTHTHSLEREFNISIKHRECQHCMTLESSMMSETVSAPRASCAQVCMWVGGRAREDERKYSCQSSREASKAIRYPVGSSVPCVSHTPRSHWLSVGTHLSACAMRECEKMIVKAAYLVLREYHAGQDTKDKENNERAAERERGWNVYDDAIMIQFRFLHQLCKHIQETCQILIGSSTSETVFIKEPKLNLDSLINHG